MTAAFIDSDRWVAYMAGELDEGQEIVLWQSLIDSGSAWNLGAEHARKAVGMILSQRCHQPLKGVCSPPSA